MIIFNYRNILWWSSFFSHFCFASRFECLFSFKVVAINLVLNFCAFQIELTVDSRGTRFESLNNFMVLYGNTSTGVDTRCGFGPSMDPWATMIVNRAPSFALYCDDPPIVRHVSVPPTSNDHPQFYLCEVKLYAEKVGKEIFTNSNICIGSYMVVASWNYSDGSHSNNHPFVCSFS